MIEWKVPTNKFLRPIGTITVRLGLPVPAVLGVRALLADQHEAVTAEDLGDLVRGRSLRHS